MRTMTANCRCANLASDNNDGSLALAFNYHSTMMLHLYLVISIGVYAFNAIMMPSVINISNPVTRSLLETDVTNSWHLHY